MLSGRVTPESRRSFVRFSESILTSSSKGDHIVTLLPAPVAEIARAMPQPPAPKTAISAILFPPESKLFFLAVNKAFYIILMLRKNNNAHCYAQSRHNKYIALARKKND